MATIRITDPEAMNRLAASGIQGLNFSGINPGAAGSSIIDYMRNQEMQQIDAMRRAQEQQQRYSGFGGMLRGLAEGLADPFFRLGRTAHVGLTSLADRQDAQELQEQYFGEGSNLLEQGLRGAIGVGSYFVPGLGAAGTLKNLATRGALGGALGSISQQNFLSDGLDLGRTTQGAALGGGLGLGIGALGKGISRLRGSGAATGVADDVMTRPQGLSQVFDDANLQGNPAFRSAGLGLSDDVATAKLSRASNVPPTQFFDDSLQQAPLGQYRLADFLDETRAPSVYQKAGRTPVNIVGADDLPRNAMAGFTPDGQIILSDGFEGAARPMSLAHEVEHALTKGLGGDDFMRANNINVLSGGAVDDALWRTNPVERAAMRNLAKRVDLDSVRPADLQAMLQQPRIETAFLGDDIARFRDAAALRRPPMLTQAIDETRAFSDIADEVTQRARSGFDMARFSDDALAPMQRPAELGGLIDNTRTFRGIADDITQRARSGFDIDPTTANPNLFRSGGLQSQLDDVNAQLVKRGYGAVDNLDDAIWGLPDDPPSPAVGLSSYSDDPITEGLIGDRRRILRKLDEVARGVSDDIIGSADDIARLKSLSIEEIRRRQEMVGQQIREAFKQGNTSALNRLNRMNDGYQQELMSRVGNFRSGGGRFDNLVAPADPVDDGLRGLAMERARQGLSGVDDQLGYRFSMGEIGLDDLTDIQRRNIAQNFNRSADSLRGNWMNTGAADDLDMLARELVPDDLSRLDGVQPAFRSAGGTTNAGQVRSLNNLSNQQLSNTLNTEALKKGGIQRVAEGGDGFYRVSFNDGDVAMFSKRVLGDAGIDNLDDLQRLYRTGSDPVFRAANRQMTNDPFDLQSNKAMFRSAGETGERVAERGAEKAIGRGLEGGDDLLTRPLVEIPEENLTLGQRLNRQLDEVELGQLRRDIGKPTKSLGGIGLFEDGKQYGLLQMGDDVDVVRQRAQTYLQQNGGQVSGEINRLASQGVQVDVSSIYDDFENILSNTTVPDARRPIERALKNFQEGLGGRNQVGIDELYNIRNQIAPFTKQNFGTGNVANKTADAFNRVYGKINQKIDDAFTAAGRVDLREANKALNTAYRLRDHADDMILRGFGGKKPLGFGELMGAGLGFVGTGGNPVGLAGGAAASAALRSGAAQRGFIRGARGLANLLDNVPTPAAGSALGRAANAGGRVAGAAANIASSPLGVNYLASQAGQSVGRGAEQAGAATGGSVEDLISMGLAPETASEIIGVNDIAAGGTGGGMAPMGTIQGGEIVPAGFAPNQSISRLQALGMFNDALGGTVDTIPLAMDLVDAYGADLGVRQPLGMGEGGELDAGQISALSGLESIGMLRDTAGNFGTRLAGKLNIPFHTESQLFNQARKNLGDILARLRTGAAINEVEERLYLSEFMPGLLDTPETIDYKLDQWERLLNRIIQTGSSGMAASQNMQEAPPQQQMSAISALFN